MMYTTIVCVSVLFHVAIVLSVLSFSTWSLYYLFCPFPRGHCIICSVLFHVAIVLSVLSFSTWPLYYLFCPFPRGHCIICSVLFHVAIVLSVLSFSTWPLYYLFCPFPRGYCINCSVLRFTSDFLIWYFQSFLSVCEGFSLSLHSALITWTWKCWIKSQISYLVRVRTFLE
jgi:hypothetical protein